MSERTEETIEDGAERAATAVDDVAAVADVEVLHGGVANAGAVVRAGTHVLRPSNPHTPTIHAFLGYLAAAGFAGASRPVGIDADGRERLDFIAGDVPVPPYPAWSQSDESLASIARLLRRYHDATTGFVPPPEATWSDEMADRSTPADAQLVICHNDVCLENVVFHDGVAVALLDFDFAAPGRRAHDLANFARMCVPIDDESSVRLGWRPADQAARLRLVADAYDLDGAGRAELFETLAGSITMGGQFVRRRVEAGDANFIAMWDAMGGQQRFDRRREWFDIHAARFRNALG